MWNADGGLTLHIFWKTYVEETFGIFPDYFKKADPENCKPKHEKTKTVNQTSPSKVLHNSCGMLMVNWRYISSEKRMWKKRLAFFLTTWIEMQKCEKWRSDVDMWIGLRNKCVFDCHSDLCSNKSTHEPFLRWHWFSIAQTYVYVRGKNTRV